MLLQYVLGTMDRHASRLLIRTRLYKHAYHMPQKSIAALLRMLTSYAEDDTQEESSPFSVTSVPAPLLAQLGNCLTRTMTSIGQPGPIHVSE